MTKAGFYSLAGKSPLASLFVRYWLLELARWRHKRGGVEEKVINLILSHSTERVSSPNIDIWRFPDGYPWNSPYSLFKTLNYVRTNSDRLCEAFARLADDKSRSILLEVIAFRALGPEYVRLPANKSSYWDAFNVVRSWIYQNNGKYGGFELYSFMVPTESGPVSLSCWIGSVVYSFLFTQYFFYRGDVSIKPEEGDVVLDLGACFGDTALTFAIAVGEGGHIYSFDPLPVHNTIFNENMTKNPQLESRVTLVDRAVSDSSDRIIAFSDASAGSKVDQGGQCKAKTISIDDFVERRGLRNVNFIKMDIEGSEMSALYGCQTTIRNFCPKLAISIYHRPQDLHEIVNIIYSMDYRYQLYVEQYTCHDEEVILYAHIPGGVDGQRLSGLSTRTSAHSGLAKAN